MGKLATPLFLWAASLDWESLELLNCAFLLTLLTVLAIERKMHTRFMLLCHKTDFMSLFSSFPVSRIACLLSYNYLVSDKGLS